MLSFFFVRNFCNFIALEIYISVNYAVIFIHFIHEVIERRNSREKVRS
jgi:hypothetical protein